MKKILIVLFMCIASIASGQTDLMAGRTSTQVKTFLSLGNVENTAISTWAGSTNVTTLGTIATGTWNGSLITGTYGGTGVNNGSSTITIGGNLTLSGSFTTTFTVTGNTSVTLPTSGTLVNTAVTTLSSLASIGTITTGTWNGTDIAVADGGTGVSSFTAYAPLVAGTTGTGALQQATTGLSTSGYVLTSNGSSAVPSFQAPSGGFAYSTITADQTGVVGNAYVNNKAGSRLVVTLPTTASVGQEIAIFGYSSQGWEVEPGTGVTVRWSGTSSTTGTSGYIRSSSQYDYIKVTCIVANTDWEVTSAQGTLTVN